MDELSVRVKGMANKRAVAGIALTPGAQIYVNTVASLRQEFKDGKR